MNLLLASLPDAERERLSPYLKKVVMEFQQVLIEPNEEITDLYFPYDAITSTIQEMSDGDSVETGLMGVEGFIVLIRQEFMAMMLGVHRPTVSTAANMLQQAGLIRYSRGQMQVLDEDGLRNGSCECLEIIEKQFDRIFAQPIRRDTAV